MRAHCRSCSVLLLPVGFGLVWDHLLIFLLQFGQSLRFHLLAQVWSIDVHDALPRGARIG